jgi:hypothetical protein
MGTTHGAEELLGLSSHGYACQADASRRRKVLPRMAIFRKNPNKERPAKIFYEARNFVP